MDMQITEDALTALWDMMCCHQSFRPAVSIFDFEQYWLLLRIKWKLGDKNHPDTWIHHYELESLWLLIENKWTL